MELSSQEEEILMPIPVKSTTYGGEHGNGHGHEGHGNMAHHHHLHQDTYNGSSISQKQALQGHHHQDQGPYMEKKKKKEVTIRYRECLKNHAASMGGNVLDGCGEFMPSGEEGTIEALTCSACHCHRNFHRKEVQGDDPPPPPSCYKFGRKLYFGDRHQKSILATAPEQALAGYPTGNILPSRTVPPPQPRQMILPYNIVGPTSGPLVPSESDEQEDVVAGAGGGGMMMSSGGPGSSSQIVVKKRFRTKFTQEQKEKMLDFAERVGWKIQKQEESVLQQFCQEIGVRRRVLKVWMHNNKHNLAKQINNAPPPPPATSTTTTTLVS